MQANAGNNNNNNNNSNNNTNNNSNKNNNKNININNNNNNLPAEDITPRPPVSGEKAACAAVFTELKERINLLYHRRENTQWTDKERNALKLIAKRPDVLNELTEIEDLYNSGYQYRGAVHNSVKCGSTAPRAVGFWCLIRTLRCRSRAVTIVAP